MIYDLTTNLSQYACLSPHFAAAIDWLTQTDLAALPPDGNSIAIAGDDVFAIPQTYTTFTPAEQILESHQTYHDIQLLLDGEEHMRIVPAEAHPKIVDPYDAQRDAAFYDPAADGPDLLLTPERFLILTPEDLHGPNRTIGDTPRQNTKVVVKVRV